MGLLIRRRAWIAILLYAIAAVGLAAGPTEYQVKAVFLFNFSQFVDWPPHAFADARSPLIIGVLGEDPFGAALDEAVQGETVNGRPLEVRRYRNGEEIDRCHILFINLEPQYPLEDLLRRMHERSVLTVSDARAFAQTGGVIELATVDNKIRLQINLDAAKLANLTISSKLLRPARIVTTARG